MIKHEDLVLFYQISWNIMINRNMLYFHLTEHQVMYTAWAYISHDANDERCHSPAFVAFFSIPFYTVENIYWKHLFSFVTLMIIILKTNLGYVLSCWLLINEKWFLAASWREQITSDDDMCFLSDQHVWVLFFNSNKNKVSYYSLLQRVKPKYVSSQMYHQLNANLLWCETHWTS